MILANSQHHHSRQPRWRLTGLALIGALALTACSDNDSVSEDPVINQPDDSVISNFVIPLSPEQQVPALAAATASGEGNFDLDTETGSLNGSVAVSGLSGIPSMAHLHRGFAGTNGGVVVALSGNETGSVWSVPAGTVLDTEQLAAFTAGEMYINVHTELYPAGEIRGQILPANIQVIRSLLSGAQQNPPVTSDAAGTATMTFNTQSGDVFAVLDTEGVVDATMAHIHRGARNENNEVVLGLEQTPDNPAQWRTPASSALNAAALENLANDGLYYNVHTPLNPAGEIRGQIIASGNAADAVEFAIRIDNISDETTLPTSAGSVAVPLSPGVYLVHRESRNPLLDPRDPASPALEALAEDGNASLFPAAVGGAMVFDTPDGASQPGPLLPGNSYSFSVMARPGDALAIATMFVQSNDWFYSTTDADDDSISLFDAAGAPISGDVTDRLSLWESGTEVDEEPGTGPNQAPRQSGPNTGSEEGDTVGSLAGRGKSVTLNGEVLRVTITPVQ